MAFEQYQSLPKVYVQNASLEIATTRTVREGGNIAGVNVVPFFTEGLEGIDVNSEAEWEHAVERAAAYPHLLPPIEQMPFPVERLPAACRISS